MDSKIIRIKSTINYTRGILLIDDKFECYTIEDGYRDVKEWGQSRIPNGTYEIGLRTQGALHSKYKKRFTKTHVGMLQIENVYNYRYVLVHIGNTARDTSGCILVGEKIGNIGGVSAVLRSEVAYTKLYPKIARKIKSGEKCILKIDSIEGV